MRAAYSVSLPKKLQVDASFVAAFCRISIDMASCAGQQRNLRGFWDSGLAWRSLLEGALIASVNSRPGGERPRGEG